MKKRQKSHPRKFGKADRKKGQDTRRKRLTPKQQRFIAEYLKTGNASHAIRSAYDVKDKYAATMGYQLLHTPKIQKKIDEAMKAVNLDEDFAVKALKSVIQAGQDNADDARPGDALRGLEMFFKMKGYLGTQKQTLKVNFKQKAEGMTTEQIKKELKKLDDRQDKLFELMRTGAKEGEVIDADSEVVGDEV